MAFEVGEFVTIGVTSDSLVQDKYLAEFIQPYEDRVVALQSWLDQEFGSHRYCIVQNEDLYNPLILDPTLEAVILVDKTLHHGKRINAQRKKAGLPPVGFVMTRTTPVCPSSGLRKIAYRDKYGKEPPPPMGTAKVDQK